MMCRMYRDMLISAAFRLSFPYLFSRPPRIFVITSAMFYYAIRQAIIHAAHRAMPPYYELGRRCFEH